MSDLMRRRADTTRREIMDAAVALFRSDGFESTSIEAVADAAGVSRRTVYRYFPAKEDLIFEHVARWFYVLRSVVESRDPGESTRDICRRGHLEVAAFIAADPTPVLDAYDVVAASPALQAHRGRTNGEWAEYYARLILADTGDGRSERLAALAAGSALIAVTNALFPVWAAEGGEADLVELTRNVLDQVDSIWPAACR